MDRWTHDRRRMRAIWMGKGWAAEGGDTAGRGRRSPSPPSVAPSTSPSTSLISCSIPSFPPLCSPPMR